jgi:hypothetical protein
MAGYAVRVAGERSGSCRDTMVAPLARAAGKISIDSATARMIATLRREKGHDIAAACGQLRLQTKKAEGAVRLSV